MQQVPNICAIYMGSLRTEIRTRTEIFSDFIGMEAKLETVL
jgi:hypothetical protein